MELANGDNKCVLIEVQGWLSWLIVKDKKEMVVLSESCGSQSFALKQTNDVSSLLTILQIVIIPLSSQKCAVSDFGMLWIL
jgi:hypothetical protein